MSYLVQLHMCGGSAGEAMEPIEVEHVSTLDEARVIESTVHAHPASDNGNELWLRIVEIPEISSGSKALSKVMSNYYFEDWEYDNE